MHASLPECSAMSQVPKSCSFGFPVEQNRTSQEHLHPLPVNQQFLGFACCNSVWSRMTWSYERVLHALCSSGIPPALPTVEERHLRKFLEKKSKGFTATLDTCFVARATPAAPVLPSTSGVDLLIPPSVESLQDKCLVLCTQTKAHDTQQQLLLLLYSLNWLGKLPDHPSVDGTRQQI